MKNLSYALPLAAKVLEGWQGKQTPLIAMLKALGGHFGMYRVTSRLAGGPFGLFSESENLLNSSWTGGWKDPWIKRCVQLQSWSMVGYYPLEHAVWAGIVAPNYFKFNVNRLVQVSCLFWSTWLLIDFFATYRRFKELDRMEEQLRKDGELDSRNRAILHKSRLALKLHLARVAMFLPNALHWCLPSNHRYSLPLWLVDVFGLGEGLVGTYTFASGLSISRPAISREA
mmetsp:Transcript_36580/g.57142  ORF Transcript_36580/g.57142 Transcript_36580/m.57142 type:complete len:228 (+) Transcript_36580:82-765(+)